VFKKADPTDTNNYCGITLMSHVGKVVAKIYAIRLDEYVEAKSILPEAQRGFHRGRGTTDMMLVTRLLAAQASVMDADMT
jgi:hypothetical protein